MLKNSLFSKLFDNQLTKKTLTRVDFFNAPIGSRSEIEP